MSEAKQGSRGAAPVVGEPAAEPIGADPAVGDADYFEDEVSVRLPAHSIYVGVLRAAMAAVAARADFTVDDIEDLRIAVDEACALLLARAADGAVLSCHIAATEDSVVTAVSTTVVDLETPDKTSFGWLVLDALAGAVRAEFDGDIMTILLSRSKAN